jgi:uncharacterized protein
MNRSTRLPLAATLSLLALAWGMPARADYKAGLDALAVRNYAKARAEFEGEPANAAAIYQLSLMASSGLGEPRNEARATSLLERASSAGHALATVDLAYALGNGKGVAKDPARAVALLEQLAAKNNDEALVTLGSVLRYGWWGISADEKRAAGLFKQAADAGNLAGKTHYALALILGVGVQKDQGRGAELLRDAADRGYTAAQVELARLLQYGEAGLSKDPAAAFELNRKAADRGNRAGQYGVALAYWNGWGVPKEPETAVRWADAAARQGDPWAQIFLADAFQAGIGVPRVRSEAFYWLTIASKSATRAAERASERRATLAKDMPQSDLDAIVRRAAAFQAQPGFRPRATPLPDLARGDSISVGSSKIEIPMPTGYVNGWQPVEWVQKVRPNDPDLRPLLMVLSRQEDVERVKLGLPGSYRSIEVAQFGTDSNMSVTPALFADMKKQLREMVDKSIASGNYRLEQVLHDDEQTYSFVRSGISRADRVDGLALVLIKQRVLWLSYTGFTPEQLAELKQVLKSSVENILARNRGLFGG